MANTAQQVQTSETPFANTNVYRHILTTVGLTYYVGAFMGILRSNGVIQTLDDTAAMIYAGTMNESLDYSPSADITANSPGYIVLQCGRPQFFSATLSGGSVAYTDVGKPVYAVNNYQVTMDPSSLTYKNFVGWIDEVLNTTALTIKVRPYMLGQSYSTQTASITPAAVLTITATEQTFTVYGLRTTDKVVVSPPSAVPAGLAQASARVSAADTLAITWVNPTAGSLTPPAGVYKVAVLP